MRAKLVWRRVLPVVASAGAVWLVLMGWPRLAPEPGGSAPPPEAAKEGGALLTGDDTVEMSPAADREAAPSARIATKGLHPSVGAVTESAFAAFNEWVAKYQAASPEARRALEAEGKDLASQRRAAMYSLIHTDPKRANELALPLAVREQMPASIQALLEERVSGRGEYAVLGVYPLPGREREVEPIQRFVTLNGKKYRAYVYGARADHPSKADLPFHGVAVDGALAMHESPVRRLEVVESARLSRAGLAEAYCGFDPRRRVLEVNEPTPVEVGGGIVWLCRYKHIEELREKMLAAAGQPGSSAAEGGTAESAYTEGRKRLILFRVAFSNVPTPAVSSNDCATIVANMDRFWRLNSYGRASVALPGQGTDIVQINLPSPSTAYDGNAGALRDDVRAAATAAGYDLSRYDSDITYTGAGQPAFDFGGLGYVGGPGAWVVGNSTSITAHELGHNLGFPHANFWETGGESAIGPGGNQEYGDPYDVMGGGSASGGTGPGHYVAKFKWYIGWIDDEHFPRVTTSGTYRIYAHDTPDATGLRGVRFQRDGALDYHLEFRRLYTSNPWLMNGIGLRWGSRTGSSSQLIDTTPGSPDGKTDSAIVIGRTFSDPDAGVHITPIRLGNTYPESIDVVLNFGTFPGNRRPSGLVSASPTVTAAGGTVTLRMEATDPDGDALAYYWDFDDGTFGANSPTVTKNWGAAGDYSVRCTVSDMKGGTYSESVLVRVGNPATFQISGRVLGPEGPVADVLIRAGSRTTYSDSDGTYTLTRLSAGSYTVSAQLYPHTFVSPFFSNPVSVGPNAANIDFISVTAPQDDVTLVANGSVWKYLANGSNQGAAWRAAAYNDAAWPSGPAQLGYGDGDEATVVSYGPDANNKYITTYFRRAFTVANSAGLTNFTLSILRDDGAAVYLNGVEVLRDNLPAGASYNTTAIDNSEDTTVVGINPSLVLPGTNVLAVEVHQVSPTSSDLSFDLSFTATTITNFSGLSAFYIASPADRAVFNEGATVTVATRALSTGHPFTRVEFFADGARIGEDTTAPFTLDWAAPSVGHHVLTARATDAASNVSTAAPVRITIERPPVETLLIAAGSEWRYLDDGSNQGSAWRQPDFDDSGWSVGPAELGYGDADEATVVRYGPSAANKYITTYFRRTFEVEDPTIITNLVLGLLRDDGAVVYLNGVEAYRNNLPAGPIAYNTLAVTAVEDDDTFLSANLDPALLVVGPNVIAVEIHQQAVNSSDISFDLRLAAQVTEPRPPGVYLAAPASGSSLEAPVSPEIAAIAMPAPGENTVSVAFYANGLLLGEDASAPYGWSWINPAPGVYSLSALALGSGGTLHTSAPVVVTITAPPAGRQLISPGAAWRYLDDGSNAGTAWRSRTFNDSGWRMGYARLGYGGDGEQTTVGYGPDATRRFITTYFRHAFTLTSLADIERLRLSLSADDGAVVYLNGAEVHRQNLGAGAVSHNSLALSDVSGAAETAFTDVALSPSTLVIGTNVIAVEVHLFRTNDTDLGFDLALVAETSPAGLGEVYLISPAEGAEFTLPGGVALEAFASAPGDTVTEVEFLANGASVGADATVPYAMNWNPLVGSYELSAVAHLAGGGSRTSAPVRITVSAPPLVVASVLTTFKPSAAQWRYLSSDAPSGWTLPDFNDSAWAQGRARLGWGLDGEATTLPSGRITHYFRSTFAVDNPALYDTLILQLQRDDGAVVYLNGFELVRSNMPNGPITASTLALATLDGRDEQEFGITTMPAAGLTAGTNVIAVELHQASATSSDGGFDLHLSGSGNTAPRVVLGSPVNNAFFAVPAVVPIEAYVWPGSGRTVARVEFFANGAKLGERTAPPYRFNWNNPVAGRHTLRARARDSFGDTIESAVASIEVGQPTVSSNFVRAGSVWKYLDTGVNLGASWAQPAFNDAGWPSGPAQLGYGDNDEATRVNFGPSSTSKYITTYFRRRFEVPPGMVFTNLTFRLLRDDGAVVWLNGREAFRSNMPASGTIAFNTLASASVGGADESTFFVTSLTITNLPVGTNVVAVEVHQNAPDSSDISFDLELIATGYAQPITPPEVALRRLEDGRVEISWPASATGWLLHSSPNLEPGSWTRVSDAPTLISGRYVVTVNPAQADTTFYRLQR